MTVSKITNAPTQNELIDKVNEVIDNLGGGGGSSTDVQINGTSITSQGVANILTNTAYDASSNKIATMDDLPSTSGLANTNLSNLSSTGEAHFLKNTATSTGSLTILGTATTYSPYSQSTNIGHSSVVQGSNSTAIGYNSSAGASYSTALGAWTTTATSDNHNIAIGCFARTNANSAIQIGYGTNSNANTLNVGFYNTSSTHYNWELLDGTTGLIPEERLSHIAPTLFEFKWFDHLINNQNWLRADTFSWHSGSTYSNPYNHLVSDISGITAETETIGSYTVTFYRATDGHKVCLADQEQTVLDIYNESGIAWYYILDTTNTRFKAPRTKFGFEGLRDYVGNAIDPTLPNITGSIRINGVIANSNNTTIDDLNKSGVFNKSEGVLLKNGTTQTTSASWYREAVVKYDASESSSIYQNNATVQEPATQMYLYFYVGGFTQNATLQTAGLNSELFNGKADTNLLNLPNNLSTPFFDGQWVSSHLGINSNLNVGSYSYSLNSYLPNDNYTYEILCQIDIAYNSASAALWVGTVASPADNQTSAGNFYATGYVMSSSKHSHFQCILPIDAGRTLYTQVAVAKLAQADVNIMGYRRIGTNT